MRRRCRQGRGRLCLAVALALMLAAPQGAQAYLTPEERQSLDLDYEVKDPDASFFDVAARIQTLRATDDPMLRRVMTELGMSVSCRSLKAQPVLDGVITLPSFYDNPDEWDLTAEPLLAFEQTASDLAGAWVATGDHYYANCLLDMLVSWAKEDALYEFDFHLSRPQAWYAIESMIFSAALAYSTITGEIEISPERRKIIDDWLVRTALRHFNTPAPQPSCCNNHYYRRSLYMTIVGVVADNDEMFETGLRSIYSALDDIQPNGALGLAMNRGWRAIHYQNYSLLYLVMTMQVAYQQGYDLFEMKLKGRGFEDAVAFLLRALRDTYRIEELPPGEQDMSFTNDEQYFSWMEVWLSHFDNPAMERFAQLYRPLFNRGAGGYMTLYFKRPQNPRMVILQDRETADAMRLDGMEMGARYPRLDKWRRTQ